MIVPHVKQTLCLAMALILVLGMVAQTVSAEGLTGYYYPRAKKNGPVVSGPHSHKVIDKKIDFGTSTWAWQPFGMKEHFSVYWTGWIHIETGGSYAFATFSDDGSYLYINDKKVVDNNKGYQEPLWGTGSIDLLPGHHKIELVYYNWKDSSGIGLYWDTGGGAMIVPGDILFPEDSRPSGDTP